MPAARTHLVKYPIEFKIYCLPNFLEIAGGSAHPVHLKICFTPIARQICSPNDLKYFFHSLFDWIQSTKFSGVSEVSPHTFFYCPTRLVEYFSTRSLDISFHPCIRLRTVGQRSCDSKSAMLPWIGFCPKSISEAPSFGWAFASSRQNIAK